MTTFEDAKVGDRVWCVLYGWSTVVGIREESSLPLKTNKGSYLYDGRLSINSGRTLFWDKIVITPPEKPLPKLEYKKTINREAIKAALQGAAIHIIDATKAIKPPKYIPSYPEIKQHEQYGWYRKFDTKNKH